MEKPKIAIKLKQNNYDGIRTLASTVYLSMNANPNFVNPQPTLAALQAAEMELTDAITQWGTAGHRGSRIDHVKLVDKALRLHRLLTALGEWCNSTIDPDLQFDDQAAILLSSGFSLKAQRKAQGKLPAPRGLRRLVQPNLSLQQVKLKWEKPLTVAISANVKGYKIYRNAAPDFYTAACIDAVRPTVYIDTPGAGIWYYWVVGTNVKGNGVESEMLEADVPQTRLYSV